MVALRRILAIFLGLVLAHLTTMDPLYPQAFVELGLQNSGKLATEVTHTVRPPSMPGHVYFGGLLRRGKLAGHAVVSITKIEINRCEGPCSESNRFSLRPENLELELQVVYYELGVGFSPGMLAYGGVCLLVLDGGYANIGATPMGRLGACGRLAAGPLALSAAWSWPQKPGWTVLNEHSGAKQRGQPHNDMTHVLVLRAGLAARLP